MNWSIEWPETPGWYWFYGWCWRDRDREPEMHLVRVSRTANDRARRVTNGHFLFKGEKGFGYWAEARKARDASHQGAAF